MTVYERIKAIEDERSRCLAEFDSQLDALKAEAMQELEAARAQVTILESVIGVSRPAVVRVVMEHTEFDETDAGNGIGGYSDDSGSLRDEVAELRARSVARRKARA